MARESIRRRARRECVRLGTMSPWTGFVIRQNAKTDISGGSELLAHQVEVRQTVRSSGVMKTLACRLPRWVMWNGRPGSDEAGVARLSVPDLSAVSGWPSE